MLKIIYSDDFIAVALKPRGVLSEGGTPGGMPELLRNECGGDFRSVHRLDRETAGLMVFARGAEAAAALSAALQAGRFRKEYAAVVHGVPTPPEGEYRDLLYRDARANKTYLVTRPRRGVREAVLTYRTEATVKTANATFSLVAIRLGTGRTHQIRAQFAGRGMPLFGDGRYGGRERAPLGLFACALSFPHPMTGKRLSFREALPEEEAFLLFADSGKNG